MKSEGRAFETPPAPRERVRQERGQLVSRFPRILIALALAASIGLHWSFLQSLAWVGMFISYSHEASLKAALVKTFDGQHPCALCKQVAQGKQAEKKAEFEPAGKKFEFSYTPAVFEFRAPSYCWETSAPAVCAAPMAHTPPVPPPRVIPG
jgi:hypothetical protein